MFEKTRKLPLLIRIVFTILLSAVWIIVAANLDIDLQSNWILSTLVIAGISSIFFPFSKQENSPKE